MQHFGKLFFQVSHQLPPPDGQGREDLGQGDRGAYGSGGIGFVRDFPVLIVDDFGCGLGKTMPSDHGECAEGAQGAQSLAAESEGLHRSQIGKILDFGGVVFQGYNRKMM